MGEIKRVELTVRWISGLVFGVGCIVFLIRFFVGRNVLRYFIDIWVFGSDIFWFIKNR